MTVMREDFQHNLRTSGPYAAITMVVWRLGTIAASARGLPRLALKVAYVLANHVWVKIIIGSDLSPNVTLGRRLCLPHGGRGLFISNGVSIGDDCTIHQQVTIGVTLDKSGAPQVGDRVYVGAKASVVGPVRIENDCTVGAHAFVLRDVAAESVAVGVPASSRPKSTASGRSSDGLARGPYRPVS
ncbi:serine O-acetyltransferase [Rhodococcoides kroppenstedtii]|uniref:serine O-acetyltransferase n=1 Tax=Rhodococcoides kroppenstedtii TaxID=293050 RepID=UPI003644D643